MERSNVTTWFTSQIGLMDQSISEDKLSEVLLSRIYILELVQRNIITREQGDNILKLLKSANSDDVMIGRELLNNFK